MKINSMQKLLDSYIDGDIIMHHQMNVFLNSDIDYLSMIGQYLYEQYKSSGKSHDTIELLIKRMERLKFGYIKRKKRLIMYDNLGIFFLTSILDEQTLENMFGEGIKHSEFGEGFDEKRDYKYISYMVESNEVIIHIGLDHRGTSISFNTLDGEKVYLEMIKLIDLFIQKF
jgi:hypothetical protein